MLSEEEKRMLTEEVLGECWHIPIEATVGEIPVSYGCTKCNYSGNGTNRTFDTWQDLGDLKNKIVEIGEWQRFVWWCRDDPKLPLSCQDISVMQGIKYYPALYFDWLLDPVRFCELVAEWWEERRGVEHDHYPDGSL